LRENRLQTNDSRQDHFSLVERQRIVDTLLAALREDERVAGVLVVGSGSEGFEDIYSDVDLCVVIGQAEDVRPAFQEWGNKLEELLPVFCCGESVRGPNSYLWALLLDNFLEVDVGFLCLDDLYARRGRWKTVFDRSGRIEDIMHTSWANRAQPNYQEMYDRRVSWVWHYIIHATIAAQRRR
jgi:predicted nucleotidyltransferase